jgi:hypothetical protein
MKALVLMAAVTAGVTLVASPADAAPKKRATAPATRVPVTVPHPYSHRVCAADGLIESIAIRSVG